MQQDKEMKKSWTEDDFENMSWHDNHVHGFTIRSGEYGAGEIEFNIDYISEWIPCEEKSFRFLIAPALLTFRDVTNLKLNLDYKTPTAALTPFSIHQIHYDKNSKEWRIEINWPNGDITFDSSGYNQEVIGDFIESDGQFLDQEIRTQSMLHNKSLQSDAPKARR